MKRLQTGLTALASVLALTVAGGPVWAQAYPAKPVRIIVPFGAGGGTDIQGRLLAQKFQDAVDQLNADLAIPKVLDALQESDIPDLARAACHEAHTGYPVPRYMTQAQCEDMIRKVLPGSAKAPAAKKKKA